MSDTRVCVGGGGGEGFSPLHFETVLFFLLGKSSSKDQVCLESCQAGVGEKKI